MFEAGVFLLRQATAKELKSDGQVPRLPKPPVEEPVAEPPDSTSTAVVAAPAPGGKVEPPLGPGLRPHSFRNVESARYEGPSEDAGWARPQGRG